MVSIFGLFWSSNGMGTKGLKRQLIRCARCGRTYNSVSVRCCPHPAVLASYGGDMCYFCCKHCRHHIKHPLCGAIGCGYS